MKIGEKLKEGRMRKEMTQEDVAEVLHVSRSTISSWEVNRTYPDLEMLVALSDLYDISLDVILREDNQIVENIVKETKNSKKRKGWIIVLLLVFIPITLFLGYQLWNASLVVTPNQIENVTVKKNGLQLNSESQIFVTFKPDSFQEYSGYWMETTGADNIISLQVYESYTLSSNNRKAITIPVNLDILEDYPEEVETIEIRGFNSSDIKTIYVKTE